MSSQRGNDVIALALHLARQANQFGVFDGFMCGYQLGVVNMAATYLDADQWIAQGARNEINYMSRTTINKGVR